MAGAGYRPADIDEMAWADALILFDHWLRWPPAHEAIRRIGIGLGIEKEIKKVPTMDEILDAKPAGCLSIRELRELAANTNFSPERIANG